jgi:hypothetical protein
VSKKGLEEESVCVNFSCKLGKNFTETFQLLNQAHRERVSSTKESMDESVKNQGIVGRVF